MKAYCRSCIRGNLTSVTACLWGKGKINVNFASYGKSKRFFGGVQIYAAIKTGGKQYKVAEGDSVFVEKLEVKPGDETTSDEVILVNDGKSTKISTPVVEDAKVAAKVERQGEGKKVVTFKRKPKKHSHTKCDHRQPCTKVTIESIEA